MKESTKRTVSNTMIRLINESDARLDNDPNKFTPEASRTLKSLTSLLTKPQVTASEIYNLVTLMNTIVVDLGVARREINFHVEKWEIAHENATNARKVIAFHEAAKETKKDDGADRDYTSG